MTRIEAQDAADAEALIGHLMRTHPTVAAADNVSNTALMQEVSELLRDFNQSIQDEEKDRKYRCANCCAHGGFPPTQRPLRLPMISICRFIVKRLMKQHQRTSDTVDEEL